MKNKLIYMVLGLLVFTSSCKKKPSIPTSGSATAKFNEQNWTANSVKGYSLNDSVFELNLQIQKIGEFNQSYVYEMLFIKMIKKNDQLQFIGNVGYQDNSIITKPSAFLNIPFDEQGDVGGQTFMVDNNDSLNNWIQIIGEQDDFKKIQGHFSITLIKESQVNLYKPHYPDTIRIREGQFNLTLD